MNPFNIYFIFNVGHFKVLNEFVTKFVCNKLHTF